MRYDRNIDEYYLKSCHSDGAMKKVKREVKVFETKLFCDCGGEMVPMDTYYPTYPIKYPHRCEECGREETISGKQFPIIEYEE